MFSLVFQHTTEALAKHANVERDTLLKWRALGLFDGIETSLTGGGRGKGVQLLWHADAMARLDEILKLKREEGYSMELLQDKFRKRKAKKRKASSRAKP